MGTINNLKLTKKQEEKLIKEHNLIRADEVEERINELYNNYDTFYSSFNANVGIFAGDYDYNFFELKNNDYQSFTESSRYDSEGLDDFFDDVKEIVKKYKDNEEEVNEEIIDLYNKLDENHDIDYCIEQSYSELDSEYNTKDETRLYKKHFIIFKNHYDSHEPSISLTEHYYNEDYARRFPITISENEIDYFDRDEAEEFLEELEDRLSKEENYLKENDYFSNLLSNFKEVVDRIEELEQEYENEYENKNNIKRKI